MPLQPTEEQSHENSTPGASSASFAIRLQFRGRDRTAELAFTPEMIGQLALEAALQDVTICELAAELITAMARNENLFRLMLDNIDPATDRIGSREL